MPRRRIHPWPAYVAQRRRWLLAEAANPLWLLKDERGRALCRWCGKHLEGRRTSFCSGGKVRLARAGGILNPELWGCVEEWSLRTVPRFARACVFERDRGVCAGCGIDCPGVEARFHRQPGEDFDVWRERLRAEFVPVWGKWGGSVWEADHVVPLHRGGTGGLSNLQTLCVLCHREKSAREARERAA